MDSPKINAFNWRICDTYIWMIFNKEREKRERETAFKVSGRIEGHKK